MKTAIPLGMLLLVGAAAALHRSSPPQAAGRERPAGVVDAGTVPEAPPAPMAAAPPPVAPREAPSEVGRPAPAVSERRAAPASSVKMAAHLDRELALTVLQRDAVTQLLKERDAEIKACHAAIIASGVIDLQQYEWQVARMKEGWYRRVDALLDRAQQERFLALVHQGLFSEGLALTAPLGMTVLD